MGPGSVIIDMAADGGGNCEVTVAGEEIRRGHALVVGMTNPPAGMPDHASFLFSRNVLNLLASNPLGLFNVDGRITAGLDFNVDIAGQNVFGVSSPRVVLYPTALSGATLSAHWAAATGAAPAGAGYGALVLADSPLAYWPMDTQRVGFAVSATGHSFDMAFQGSGPT